ncbi:putative RNA-binding protein Luc7-like 2 [Mya arenaria]|uniref:putative RNA-binding protein Luc7-like 2 n=1 Tax=Mya arenaria TaxID=6604 RepID=UPI0022E84AAC|nr:putative RNA-binding protein Luc7-like 2 [Mya arenaria]
MRERMKKTSDIVKKHTDKAKDKQKKNYDRKAKAVKIKVGDRVIVKILAHVGKHKIQDNFEEEIYEVIDQPREDIPVFKIRSEKTKREKTLHRNHLVLVDYEDDEDIDVATEEPGDTSTLNDGGVQAEDVEKRELGNPDVEEKKKIGDVTEEESDSDEEVSFYYVPPTYRDGDAHQLASIEDEVVKADNGKEEQRPDIRPAVNETESPEDTVRKVIREDNFSGSGNRSDETVVKEPGIVVERDGTFEKRRGEEPGDHCTGTEPDQDEAQITDRENNRIHTRQDRSRSRSRARRREIEAEEANRSKSRSTARDSRSLSRRRSDASREASLQRKQYEEDAQNTELRRSSRQRKPPSRYEDFHMHSLVTRPTDSRIQALEELVNSGILKNIDAMIAQKLVDSVFK